MSEWIQLSLRKADVGQILDGLEVRRNQWQATASFLRAGTLSDFPIEECDDADEADTLAAWYSRILESLVKQRNQQILLQTGESDLRKTPRELPIPCFCIYTNTLFQGDIPAERDETDGPVVYATREAAERELAGFAVDRLHEFLAGERDFEDAMETGEFIVAVVLHSDGSISDESGRTFSKGSW